MRDSDDPKKLSRIEVLGAWLGLWTPPRDAEIPPVPWRKVAAGAALLAIAAGLFAAFAAPAIDEGKDKRSAAEARELDRRLAARRARQRAEQRPRLGRLDTTGSRAEGVQGVEIAIGRDARRRFNRKAETATCDTAPGADPAAALLAYQCFSAYASLSGAGKQEGARGALGVPYQAVLDFARGRYAFCKINPIPGEQIVPDPRLLVELPAACRTPDQR